MSINKINDREDLSEFLYSDWLMIELTKKIRSDIESKLIKIPKNNSKNKPKNNFGSNYLIGKLINDDREKKLSNMENNLFFKSFNDFLDKDDKILELTNLYLDELDTLIIDNIYRLMFLFNKEMALFYKGNLDIDDKTSFGQDFLHLFSLVKVFHSLENNKEKKEYFELIESLKPSKYKHWADLGYFLEYLEKDSKKAENKKDFHVTIIEEE